MKPPVTQNQDDGAADHSSIPVTTADIQAGFLATAPTLQTTSTASTSTALTSTALTSTAFEADPNDLELGDAAISDAANLQLFEDWLDEFGYFQNVFQSA